MELMEAGGLIEQIKELVLTARSNVAKHINTTMVGAYWNIGRSIVDFEQGGNAKAKYGKQLLSNLSKNLTRELGRGFSRSNLYMMRSFYLNYPIFQTISGKLSWSHYCELLGISDESARSFYEKECENSNWSVEELRRQRETSLFERLLLSKGESAKEEVYKLAKQGNVLAHPNDILKDPFVFEFVNLPENKPVLERDLENALIAKLENFLLELGRGFMYVGRQQRVTIGNRHYYVDMVFYNKILKCYVLIDLKTGELVAENVGQMNLYVNYYAKEVNDEGDNPPIGIILCADNFEVMAEYALGGLESQVFASKYTLYLPDKELLIRQVEEVIKSMNEAESGEE